MINKSPVHWAVCGLVAMRESFFLYKDFSSSPKPDIDLLDMAGRDKNGALYPADECRLSGNWGKRPID